MRSLLHWGGKVFVKTTGGSYSGRHDPEDARVSYPFPLLVDDAAMKRVLLVEDNRAAAMLLCDYLMATGWAVHHLPDGQDFLDQIRTFQPQVIALDLALPGIPGIDLLRKLRQDPQMQHLPVVVISALAARSKEIEARNAGANDYLLKPFTLESLTAALERWIS